MTEQRIKDCNAKIFRLASEHLNFYPDAVTGEMIEETKSFCGVGTQEAYQITVSGIYDVYEDRELRGGWIKKMFSCLDPAVYEEDPYRRTVVLPDICDGQWEFTNESYKPYEAFVFDDPRKDSEGRVIPSIGFFEREYTFPCVKQNGREWMLITPNEIETMREPVENAFGNVCTYGLGLGYFAFMASLKESVDSVTVVEKDESVIRLFEKHILPQFPHRDKIKLVCADAFEFARDACGFDFVFADIWHDPSDGCGAYLRLKELEKEGTKYAYWIEKTLKYYL